VVALPVPNRARAADRAAPGTVTVRATQANGRLGVVMHRHGAGGALAPHGVLLFDTDGGRITGFDAYIDDALPGVFDGF
jgi:hypothetical protein